MEVLDNIYSILVMVLAFITFCAYMRKLHVYIKEILGKVNDMYDRGNVRAGRERINDEILVGTTSAIEVLLRFADKDETLNGEVKFNIKRLSQLKEKKLNYDRENVIR